MICDCISFSRACLWLTFYLLSQAYDLLLTGLLVTFSFSLLCNVWRALFIFSKLFLLICYCHYLSINSHRLYLQSFFHDSSRGHTVRPHVVVVVFVLFIPLWISRRRMGGGIKILWSFNPFNTGECITRELYLPAVEVDNIHKTWNKLAYAT